MARFEYLTSAAAYAGSSLFWIALALFMNAGQYGHINKLQAALLLVPSFLSLRTYDLVFYLRRNFQTDDLDSFLIAIGVESVAAAVCTLLVVAFFSVGAAGTLAGTNSITWVLVAAFLASIPVVQGASPALLRCMKLDGHVAWSNLASGAAFLAGFALLRIVPRPSPIFILTVWLAANAVRPLFLIGCAVAAAGHARIVARRPWRTGLGLGDLLRFLTAGQVTNMFKNGALSLETLLLGTIASNATVAVFRLSRSFLNLPTFMFNVTYQKSFLALAASGSQAEVDQVLRHFDRHVFRIYVVMTPLTFLAVGAFAFIRKKAEYGGLLIGFPLMAIAVLPSILQNAVIAALTLNGRFLGVNAAYVGGFVVLAAGCVAISSFASIYSFAAVLFLSYVARYLLMRYWLARQSKG